MSKDVMKKTEHPVFLDLLAGPVSYFFIAGLVLRVCFVFIMRNYDLPRDYEYGEIARNILAGNGFSRSLDTGGRITLTASHAPIYPYFLCFFYNLGQNAAVYVVIQLIQSVLSALTILVVHRLAACIYDRHAAGLAALGIALYPAFIYYCTKFVPTTMLILLLSVTLMLVMEERQGGVLTPILAGITLGISVLCDPVAFAAYPALFLWWLISRKVEFQRLWWIFVLSLATIMPWTVRNYAVYKEFIPVTTQFGVNFWIGNNEKATGTDYFEISGTDTARYTLMTHTLPRTTMDSLASLDEVSRMKYYINEGIHFIIRAPGKFFRLLVTKGYYYWLFAPPHEYSSRDLARYRIPFVVFYLPVLILSILGILFLGQRLKRAVLVLLLMLFVSAIYIFTHVGLARYRVILEPYMIIFATGFSLQCIGRIRGNEPA